MTMGQKIKELRKAKGLSRQKLANEIGVHQMSIAFWEKDKYFPTLLNCFCMATLFKVSLDELCCRDGE